MHFLETLAVAFDVDQDRRKRAGDAAGGEQHAAEQFERARSPPCAAMAPMFQTTERSASRLVVTMNSRRPAADAAAAMSANRSGVICLAIRSFSGQESRKLSPVADLENVGRGDLGVGVAQRVVIARAGKHEGRHQRAGAHAGDDGIIRPFARRRSSR